MIGRAIWYSWNIGEYRSIFSDFDIQVYRGSESRTWGLATMITLDRDPALDQKTSQKEWKWIELFFRTCPVHIGIHLGLSKFTHDA
jgi:hypothetical protein